MTSTWGGVGGYLDFTKFDVANGSLVENYWIQGTAMTCVAMGLGMGYIVLEVSQYCCPVVLDHADMMGQWLLQAHLSTEDYKDAVAGLRHVRRVRRFTYWMAYPSSLLAPLAAKMLSTCRVRRNSNTKNLVWSNERTYRQAVGQTIVQLANDAQRLPFHEVDRDAHDGLAM